MKDWIIWIDSGTDYFPFMTRAKSRGHAAHAAHRYFANYTIVFIGEAI